MRAVLRSVRSISLARAIIGLSVAVCAASPAAVAAMAPGCSMPSAGASGVSGPAGYGVVHFANSCAAGVQPMLQDQVAKLHSFESDTDTWVRIAHRDPGCAVAWWGAAMSARGNPLGGLLDDASLARGRALIDHALAIKAVTPRERGLIEAMDTYYRPYADQIARARAYAERMDALRAANPDDPDVAALDGLAIIEGVDLEDKTYGRQKRAGAILQAVMAAHPENPGAPHYLIHAYDYAALAPLAVRAAQVYPTLATGSPHAQHMPSHIWSMLGEWDKSIAANRRSNLLADPSSHHDPVKGDIVYAHAFDFIDYARLQLGEDRHVAADLAAAAKTDDGAPTVIAARYALERGDWRDAERVPVPAHDPFDAALARFARAYGAARAGDTTGAADEITALRATRAPVVAATSEYWGVFVDIYADAARAWLLKAQGHDADALALMGRAAARDDGHEKHIYLENKILPMRESLGDMELALGHPREALAAYEASLALAPNRYRSFLGAAKAAEAAGDKAGARGWWGKLMALSREGDGTRPGFAEAKAALAAGNG